MEVCLLFTIRHAIQYQYEETVFVEPILLRLRPRSDVFQRLIAFDLDILPRPAGRSDNMDLDGNSSTSVWFDGTCSQLSLVATSRVETLCTDHFAYIITEESAARVPVVYPEIMRGSLEPFLRRIDSGKELDALAEEVIRATDGETVSFLCALAAQIARRFSVVVRRDGSPLRPSVTLAQESGACRDLTLLFMDICRSLGLASRFVSGYTESARDGVRGGTSRMGGSLSSRRRLARFRPDLGIGRRRPPCGCRGRLGSFRSRSADRNVSRRFPRHYDELYRVGS